MIKRILEISSIDGGYVPLQIQLDNGPKNGPPSGVLITQRGDDEYGTDNEVTVTWGQLLALITALSLIDEEWRENAVRGWIQPSAPGDIREALKKNECVHGLSLTVACATCNPEGDGASCEVCGEFVPAGEECGKLDGVWRTDCYVGGEE